jgi:hypothetical protein
VRPEELVKTPGNVPAGTSRRNLKYHRRPPTADRRTADRRPPTAGFAEMRLHA